MNFIRLSFICLALGVALDAIAFSWKGTSAEENEKKEHTKLELAMEDISDAWRKVRKQVADPASNGDTAALVAIMKKNAQAALELTPQRVEDVPVEERAAFVVAFKVEMRKFVGLLEKLEAALNENPLLGISRPKGLDSLLACGRVGAK